MTWMRWIGKPESFENERLLDTLVQCHQRAALTNQNASSVSLQLAAASGVDFAKAVSAALAVLGDKHGPATQARELIYHADDEEVREMVEDGEKVPGWGHSFFKTSIDPSFAPFAHLIREGHTEHHEHLERVSRLIFKSSGRAIYPNAAAYTAVCAEILGLAPGTELMLFVGGRLPAWASLFAQGGTS